MGCGPSSRARPKHAHGITKPQDPSNLLRTVQLTEDEIELPRLAISLSLMATVYTDEVRRNMIINETPGWRIFGIQEWESESSPETNNMYGHPYAITGLVSHHIDATFKNIPFLAFRGDLRENKTTRALVRAKGEFFPEPFLTSNGHKLGLANKPFVEMYSALRATGMTDNFLELCKRKSSMLITGHGSGGALATLISAELAVDNSFYFIKPDDKKDADKKKKVKQDELNLYAIPKMEILTFGAPRVFSKNTARKLRMMQFNERFVRFINAGDFVPTLFRGEAEHLGEVVCYRKRPLLLEDGTSAEGDDAFVGWWVRYKNSFPDFDHDQWLDVRPGQAHPVELDFKNNDILHYVDGLVVMAADEGVNQSVSELPEPSDASPSSELPVSSTSISISIDQPDLPDLAASESITSASSPQDSLATFSTDAPSGSSDVFATPNGRRSSTVKRVQYGQGKRALIENKARAAALTRKPTELALNESAGVTLENSD